MSKIMLVEDDNNLREIYEARLLAEGYEIVSAKDGEEALAMAVKEKPDLIIADVMMPKISGFDMLDILRSSPETKDAKIIMMTALGQAEDKARAQKLGADRYLVKSQVTLEDVARTAREVLAGESGSTAPTTAAQTPAPQPNAAPLEAPVASPTSIPVVSAPAQATDSTAQPTITTSIPVVDTPTENTSVPNPQVTSTPVADNTSAATNVIVPSDSPDSEQPNPVAGMPADATDAPAQPAVPATDSSDSNSKVIDPIISTPSSSLDLNTLLEKEQAKNELAGQPGNVDAPLNPTPGSSITPTNTSPSAGEATDVGKISL